MQNNPSPMRLFLRIWLHSMDMCMHRQKIQDGLTFLTKPRWDGSQGTGRHIFRTILKMECSHQQHKKATARKKNLATWLQMPGHLILFENTSRWFVAHWIRCCRLMQKVSSEDTISFAAARWVDRCAQRFVYWKVWYASLKHTLSLFGGLRQCAKTLLWLCISLKWQSSAASKTQLLRISLLIQPWKRRWSAEKFNSYNRSARNSDQCGGNNLTPRTHPVN